jgi:hypothetical protein
LEEVYGGVHDGDDDGDAGLLVEVLMGLAFLANAHLPLPGW